MAEVIWTRRAQELKNRILLYGLVTFGETSAKKLDGLLTDTVSYYPTIHI